MVKQLTLFDILSCDDGDGVDEDEVGFQDIVELNAKKWTSL